MIKMQIFHFIDMNLFKVFLLDSYHIVNIKFVPISRLKRSQHYGHESLESLLAKIF